MLYVQGSSDNWTPNVILFRQNNDSDIIRPMALSHASRKAFAVHLSIHCLPTHSMTLILTYPRVIPEAGSPFCLSFFSFSSITFLPIVPGGGTVGLQMDIFFFSFTPLTFQATSGSPVTHISSYSFSFYFL